MRYLLTLACLLCPWQIYLPETPLQHVSLLQLMLVPIAGAMIISALLQPQTEILPRSVPLSALAAFAVWCAVASLWSADPQQAILTSAKVAAIVVIALAFVLADRTTRRRAIAALGASAVLLAALVIVFRWQPLLELGFWLSPKARYVLDPDVRLGMFSGSVRYNVFDTGKAGGVFSNGNVASLFLGFVACLLLPYTRSKWVIAGVVVLALGVVATGSKSGLLAIALCGSIWISVLAASRLTIARASMGVVGGFAIVAMLAFYTVSLDLLAEGDVSLASRADVWRLAVPLLTDHPALGLGFGGWEMWAAETFRYAGIAQNYPPHNLFLIAWAWVGLGGAFLIGMVFVLAALEPWTARGRQVLADGYARWSLSLAFLWFLVHAMLDNAAFTNIAIGLPIGLALGALNTGYTSPSPLGPASIQVCA